MRADQMRPADKAQPSPAQMALNTASVIAHLPPPGCDTARRSPDVPKAAAHSPIRQCSAFRGIAANSSSPAGSSISTSCFSDAQSMPAQFPIVTSHALDDSPAPRPGGTVTDAHRQGPQRGATSCRRSRHLTTAGTGWSFIGPRTRANDRGPLPAAVETTTDCPMSNHADDDGRTLQVGRYRACLQARPWDLLSEAGAPQVMNGRRKHKWRRLRLDF
jgi:hypothetical protein